jgi:hypothetical protein
MIVCAISFLVNESEVTRLEDVEKQDTYSCMTGKGLLLERPSRRRVLLN